MDRVNSTVAPTPLDALFTPMIGLPAWSVQQGHGSFLTFEFGEPTLVVAERQSKIRGFFRSAYVHGQWHLWIYCCHWRVLQGETQLAWSEDTRELIGRASTALNGQMISTVTVDPTQGRSIFTFDLGGVLETWPYGDDPSEKQWMVLTETDAFAYRADGLYSEGRKDTPGDQITWCSLG